MSQQIESALIRVRNGEPIYKALLAEGIHNHYYRGMSDVERSPFIAARREYLGSQQSAGDIARLVVYMPKQRLQDFDIQCRAEGTNMSHRVNSMIVTDLNAKKSF
ncbi:hypothetical protein [Spirosoma luteum]|uniref:hypothetical protein n=1 Tax=Spirosoma luteum TaxID=431553 RepID=UPI000373BB22|nr:hypothetical protein [Spirosoma luteum]